MKDKREGAIRKSGQDPRGTIHNFISGVQEEYAELLYRQNNLKDQLVHTSQFIYKNKWPKSVTSLS